MKAYDVYRTAAQATDTFGTDTYAQEQAKADFKYHSSYVATAAGKCAETYISAQSGGLVGGVDTTVKGFNAAAWTMQAYHVWKTGEEDPGLKNFQDATDKASTVTYTLHITNASDFNQKALSCMYDVSASAGGQNVNESGAYTANYDEATGTLDNPYGGDRTYFYGDGSGMYFKFSSEVPAAVKQ